MRLLKPLMMILVIGLSGQAAAELTGSIRINFVQSFYVNCMSNQKTMPANKGLSDKVISQYCRCSADYSASMYTNQMVADIEAGRRKIDTSISELTTNYCRANYSRY